MPLAPIPGDASRVTLACDRCCRPYDLGRTMDARDSRVLAGMAREEGWREIVARARYVPAAWLCPLCIEELKSEGQGRKAA